MQKALPSYFLTTILMLIATYTVAQAPCAAKDPWWKDHMNYIPAEDSPIFLVRLNYVIPQKSDGTGNFSENNPEQEEQLRRSIVELNSHYLKLRNPKNDICYTGEDFIPSTYIQFVLNKIIYVKDDYFWNAENGSGCPNDGNWFLNDLEKEIRKNPEYDRAINIYMPNDSSVYEELVIERTLRDEPKSKSGCSELPSLSKLDRSSRMCIGGAYNKYWWMEHVVTQEKKFNPDLHPWSTLKQWDYSGRGNILAHELGHSMGLNHANEYHGRNKCHESIMNQLFSSPHNYLQPSEIGKMHRNLRMSNIREFLEEDVYVQKPIIIDKDRTLDIDFKAYEDFIIKSGSTLTITCALSLPEQARVIVEPGANLNIAGGKLITRSYDLTNVVIELQKEKACFLKSKKKVKKGIFTQSEDATRIGSIRTLKVK